jgi:phage/plasmid-like protein (TIGR03299 family)
MSGEIETIESPWQEYGTYIGQEPLTSQEAIVKVGLNWKVKIQDLYTAAFAVPYPDLDLVKTNKAVVREDTNKVLGIVGKDYHPIQNIEAFNFMDGLVEDGSMRYHTVGSFRGGQRVWLLGKAGSFDVVPGDQVDKYLFLYNSHDTSASLRCLFTTIRVYCENTARLVLSKQKKEGIRIKHTKNFGEHMIEAKGVLGFANQEFNKFEKVTQQLVGVQVDTQKLDNFTKLLFPDPPKGVKSYSIPKAREQIVRLFEEGRGNSLPGVKGTAWAAYNAVTEYTNYHKPTRGNNKGERRLEYNLFGSGVNLIDRAQQLLLAA